MGILKIKTKFYPIRILAYLKNEAELNIDIENNGIDLYWVEIDVVLPNNSLSLAPDKELLKGRIRGGIVFSNDNRTVRCKIYGNPGTYPDTYRIKLIAYAFDKEGVIVSREETKTELRCERVK